MPSHLFVASPSPCSIIFISIALFTFGEYGMCESASEYNNFTASRFRLDDFDSIEPGSRQSRLFSFAADDGDVKVDLEFVVPFIRIPVKRSVEVTGNAFKGLINFNTASLIVSGLFVLVGAAVGAIFKSFTSSFTTQYPSAFKKNSRIVEDVSQIINPFRFISNFKSPKGVNTKIITDFSSLIESVDKKFRDNDVDVVPCIQKSICEFFKRATTDVRSGRGTGSDKIIDGLASLEFIQEYLDGTAVQDAINSGKSHTHCEQIYQNCQFLNPQDKLLEMTMNYFNFN